MDIRNTHISVIGAARSGIAAARLVAKHGAHVFVSDTGDSSDNITSDDAAWFDGYAEPGATVQLIKV